MESRARVDSLGLKHNSWACETVIFLSYEFSKSMESDFLCFSKLYYQASHNYFSLFLLYLFDQVREAHCPRVLSQGDNFHLYNTPAESLKSLANRCCCIIIDWILSRPFKQDSHFQLYFTHFQCFLQCLQGPLMYLCCMHVRKY